MMGNYGWGNMMGGYGAFGILGLAFWLVIFIDAILLGIFLWQRIQKK